MIPKKTNRKKKLMVKQFGRKPVVIILADIANFDMTGAVKSGES